MKNILMLLAILFIPGGIVLLGKWLKSVREYSYPDLPETFHTERKDCDCDGRCGQECKCKDFHPGHA